MAERAAQAEQAPDGQTEQLPLQVVQRRIDRRAGRPLARRQA